MLYDRYDSDYAVVVSYPGLEALTHVLHGTINKWTSVYSMACITVLLYFKTII